MSSVPILGGTLSISESATIGRNLTVGGTLTFNRPQAFELSSLLLTNSVQGYSASNLNYYEEYSAAIQPTGAWTNSSYTVQIVRVGKQCTVQIIVDPIEDIVASAAFLTFNLPYRFSPAINADLHFKVPGKDNGAEAELVGATNNDELSQTYQIIIGPVYAVWGLTTFTPAATAYITSFAVTYNTA